RPRVADRRGVAATGDRGAERGQPAEVRDGARARDATAGPRPAEPDGRCRRGGEGVDHEIARAHARGGLGRRRDLRGSGRLRPVRPRRRDRQGANRRSARRPVDRGGAHRRDAGSGAMTAARVAKLAALRQLALLPVIVLALVIGSQLNGAFLTQDNLLSNVLDASAVLAVVCVAESMLIISGNFDLSLQSTVGFAPMLSAWLVVPKDAGGAGIGLSPAVGILLLFALGIAIGWLNGFL